MEAKFSDRILARVLRRRPELLSREFNRQYYDHGRKGGTWQTTRWLGVPVHKPPSDLWVYQELLYELQPDLIIETGTALGGSALFFATMCELVGNGSVVSISLGADPDRPVHPRIEYRIGGSSVDDAVIRDMTERAAKVSRVLVSLDSNHARDHVAAELRAYAPLVTPGSYVVVEDTNVNGHPSLDAHGPGPWEAVEDFLSSHPDFEVDSSCERHLLTHNPRGFLRRRA